MSTELELNKRDERVRKSILEFLGERKSQARDAEELARYLRAEAKQVEEAVREGRWWELTGVVSFADIESLSNVEPSDRADTFLNVSSSKSSY